MANERKTGMVLVNYLIDRIQDDPDSISSELVPEAVERITAKLRELLKPDAHTSEEIELDAWAFISDEIGEAATFGLMVSATAGTD